MDVLKIVVSGPVGAGKTTFITSLSDVPVVSTEEIATENIGKATTTVALDYGSLVIDGWPIHLFGTPGQERFDFMWEVLCEGAVGMLLLVAGTRPGQFTKARAILEFVTSQIPIPFVVGVTHTDVERCWAPEDIADFFGLPPDRAVGLVATDPNSSLRLLFRLFEVVTEQSQDTQTTI